LDFFWGWPGVNHRSPGYEELALEDGFIEITIDGERLRKGVTFGIPINQDVLVTLTKPIPFRGIMTRIDGGSRNIDTSTGFDFVEGESVLKRNQFCELDVSLNEHWVPTNAMDFLSLSLSLCVCVWVGFACAKTRDLHHICSPFFFPPFCILGGWYYTRECRSDQHHVMDHEIR